MLKMKNRDIEKMLKEKASKVEIPDLTQKIINNVDTSKVKVFNAPKKSRFNFKPIIYASFATAALVLTVVIGLNVKNAKNPSNNDGINTFDITPTTTSTTISDTITDDVITSIDDSEGDNRIQEVLDSDMKAKYGEITSLEAYNIVNVANTFTNVSYTTFDTKISGVDSEFGNTIIDNLDTYIYNIEDMLGVNETETIKTINDNTLYDYETKILVNSPYYNYFIYYSETLEELKNNSSGYKIKSNVEGVIVCDTNIYSFTGVKRIKNNEVRYETSIVLDDTKSVSVLEIFSSQENAFTYKYLSGEEVLKKVNITQNFNKEDTSITDNVEFVTYAGDNNKIDLTIKLVDENISCKIESRKSNLTVSKNEDGNHVYTIYNGKTQEVITEVIK